MSSLIQPVILSGGSGTRLWPLSRTGRPKQFLDLGANSTMLQATLQRLYRAEGDLRSQLLPPILIGSGKHRELTKMQLDEIGLAASALIYEPVGRNTAPALAMASLVSADMNPDALLLILPADHHIVNVAAFHEGLIQAVGAARDGRLVTFGIEPDRPDTGYGYIRLGAPLHGQSRVFEVDRFVEKPDLATAKQMLEATGYVWNSGMFLFHNTAVQEELLQHRPDIFAAVKRALAEGERQAGEIFPHEGHFKDCPSDSIDYAIMERTRRAGVVPVDIGWSDVGSFNTLRMLGPLDDTGNKITGDVIAEQTSGSLIDARSRLVATLGVQDLVIIETGDAVLVAHKDHIGDLKVLVEELKSKRRKELD